MAELFRYAAFISYSSKDARFAQRLHRALESYGIPSSLGKFDLIGGGKPNRIYPVFRDREELSAGHLGEQIEANLKASAALIVVCSRNGASSPWVQKEIEFFAAQGRHDKIFAIIPDTAPLVDEAGADYTQSCFPPAFRGDALSGDKLEPLAADARKGKDGFRNAWLKIVAGMIGVSRGQIIDRDRARRAQQTTLRALVGVALVIVAATAFSWSTTAQWRTRFSQRAAQQAAEGRVLLATSLAVAGGAGRGSLLPARAGNADQVLSRFSAVRVLGSVSSRPVQVPDDQRDRHLVGRSTSVWFSGDSSLVAVATAQQQIALFDLRSNLAPIAVPGDYVDLFERGDRAIVSLGPSDTEGPGPVRVLSKREGDWVIERTGDISEYDISSDGRYLATVSHGVARVRDLDGETVSEFGGVESVRMSGDGKTIVLERLGSPSTMLRGERESTLGDSRTSFIFPRYGGRVLVISADRMLRVHNLDEDEAPFEVGAFGINLIFPPRFSPDGTLLFVAEGGSRCLVFSVTERRLLREEAGRCDFRTGAGRYLVTHDAADEYRVAEIETTAVARNVGMFLRAYYFPETALLVGDRGGSIEALSLTDNTTRSYAGYGDWAVSSTGAHLLAREGEDVVVYRTRDGVARARFGFLSYRRLAFSNDESSMVVDQRDGQAVLYNLVSGATRDLGAIGGLRTEVNGVGRIGSIELASNGGAMVVDNEDGTATIFDLSARAPSLWPDGRGRRGADLTESVCSASGAALPPINSAMREAGDLSGSLRGRPWTPCDWRGLFAILPNADRGDGWFEGVRQWLRLLQVRHFGGRDYACEETTSAASAEARARRRDMCERFAAPGPS